MDCWFSQEGLMDETLVNDEECDIMDYLDEFKLSFLLQEEENNIIPSNFEESNTLCTSSSPSIEPFPHVLICTEKRPPPKHHQQQQQQQKRTKKPPLIPTFGNPTTTTTTVGEEEEEVLVSSDEVAAAVVGKCGNNYKSLQKKNSTAGGAAGGLKRTQSHTYDHILAERKRRELLSQQFVALTTIVPGLKKMDKTSVLGDAINYLKHLQDKVKTFEEKSTKQTMESLVILKKSQVYIEDEGDKMQCGRGYSDEQSTLPEIEAKVSEKCILLKVLCHKNKRVLVDLLTEMEKLNLCVTSINVTQFGTLALDIKIVAEIEEAFNMTIKDLIIHLQSVVRRSNEGD